MPFCEAPVDMSWPLNHSAQVWLTNGLCIFNGGQPDQLRNTHETITKILSKAPTTSNRLKCHLNLPKGKGLHTEKCKTSGKWRKINTDYDAGSWQSQSWWVLFKVQ